MNDSLSSSPPMSSISNATVRTNNGDWAIKPAVNGAYAYVSLELANIPGYYLVAERQVNGTFIARAKIINVNSDVDKFLACWRMYPGGR